MEKYILQCGRFTSFIPFPGVLLNLKQKAYLLSAVIILLLLLSVPASAAVEGILTHDSDGSYHHYSYEDLISSYITNYRGNPDGLYEDYISKKPVALLDSGNGYVDFDYVLNQYARMLIRGQSVTIDEIAGRTDVRKAEVPERIYMVTSEAGSLVRQEKKLGSQGGTGFDLENFDDQGTQVKKNPESITDQENFGEDEQEKINPTEDEEINNSTPEKETALEETSITGSSRVTISQAQAWAKSKNAHQRFVEITPVYWEYGKKTGIRPEVMYAQAALETGYGHYKGQVPASFNNWAGIKVGHSNGDNPEDHEKFATPEEGVRGHFNHMSAYVGLQPVGEPHDRYYSVKSIAWAGTVEYVEELSGKWAPSSTYHETIVRMIGEMK